MIITLTPNPSTDRTAVLSGHLTRGSVHRLESVGTQSAGKGVNISKAAVAASVETLAVVPVRRGDPYLEGLDADGVPVHPVVSAGTVRVNLSITEPDGTTTKLNSPGNPVTAEDLERLTEAVHGLAQAAGPEDWVVLAGSVPPGTPDSWYADVVRRLRDTPVRVAVDTSDAPLAALVDALPASAPDLIKPNGEELASLTGAPADDLEADPAAAARAAGTLVERGIGAVLATLGGNGAVLVTRDGAWHATPPPTTIVSTVGAGDSSLFGYLLGHERGLDTEGRLALAVAYGSAAAGLPGTTVPTPDQADPTAAAVRNLSPTA